MRKLIILSLAFYCCNVVFAAPAAPIDDLRIERQGDNYLLTWSTPVEDIYGQPIQISSYKVYLSGWPYGDIDSYILLEEVTDTAYLYTDPWGWQLTSAFFRVTAIGSSPDCIEYPWCTEEPSAAFNNMPPGAYGAMLETADMQPFMLCGFQMRVNSLDGPVRAVLYHVNNDDTVQELAAVTQTGASDFTDFYFSNSILINTNDRYAVILETSDTYWELWQTCNAGEDCCPDARPVHIEDGMAVYNDPTGGDDYFFLLYVEEGPPACVPDPWCTEEPSAAFNNMPPGAYGAMLETADMQPFMLCGFQMRVNSLDGPVRAVLYHVNNDDTVQELAAVTQTGASDFTDFYFSDHIAINADDRYAIVVETFDTYWELWQTCNAGENCCSDARPVRIENGMAFYNDPSGGDDYYFLLYVEE